jgi:ribulose-5-phosphate 4-epimerase/fuculose-1-phosphate aldolase
VCFGGLRRLKPARERWLEDVGRAMTIEAVKTFPPTPLTPTTETETGYAEERRDLACAFRWAARLGFNEGVANHFSLAVSDDGGRFLVNPYARHWARLRASDLVLVDADAPGDLVSGGAVDDTAFVIHGRIHKAVPQARCLLHTHMKYATVLSCLTDSSLPPIDQNTMRFYGQVAIDEGFEGMALEEAEGDRLARALGDKSVLVMGNHGVVVAGPTVGRAFDALYYFEKACETVVTAYGTGKALRIAPDAVARRTAAEWQRYGEMAERHFAELRAMLDEREPDYRS